MLVSKVDIALFEKQMTPVTQPLARSVAVIVVLMAVLLAMSGVWIGLQNPWLWLLGAPITLLGTLVILGVLSYPRLARGAAERDGLKPFIEAARQREKGDLEGALATLRSLEKRYESGSNDFAWSMLLWELAVVHEAMGNRPEAIHSLHRTEPFARALKNPDMLKACLAGQLSLHVGTGLEVEESKRLAGELEAVVRASKQPDAVENPRRSGDAVVARRKEGRGAAGGARVQQEGR